VTGVPLTRLGQSEEIAQTILFLGSNEASFITGQIVGEILKTVRAQPLFVMRLDVKPLQIVEEHSVALALSPEAPSTALAYRERY